MKTNHETCTSGGNSRHTDTDTSVIQVKVGHCGASMSEYIQDMHMAYITTCIIRKSQYRAIHNSKSTRIHVNTTQDLSATSSHSIPLSMV